MIMENIINELCTLLEINNIATFSALALVVILIILIVKK